MNIQVIQQPNGPITAFSIEKLLFENSCRDNENKALIPWDAGSVILACTADIKAPDLQDICSSWIGCFPEFPGRLSLYAGNGGLLFGLLHAARRLQELRPLYDRIQRQVIQVSRDIKWNRPASDWQDYDLVTGPSGFLLASLADPELSPDDVFPVVDHLKKLLETTDMAGFRLAGAKDDSLRAWNNGQINLGLAHGVPGVIAALAAYIRRFPDTPDIAPVLERSLDWLTSQSHLDENGLITWAPAAGQGGKNLLPASRREAWCYGAPANAFVLWDAADALNRHDLKTFAQTVFAKYAANFDPAFHLDDDIGERLAICHGAAGIMLIADCFARHAGSAEAVSLRQAMREMIIREQSALPQLMAKNPTLLSGASGVLLALNAIDGGSRSWLPALGLR